MSTKEADTTTATAAVAEQQADNVAHALAGAGGGLLSMALTYPLITLSTRAQVESRRAHTSTLEAVRHIVRREGVSGLYAGLESALFGISVTNFVYYYWYEWTRAFFTRAARKAGRPSDKLTTLEAMAAGALAGSATVLMTNPIWVVNTRMTARKNEAEASTLPTSKLSSSTLSSEGKKKAPSTFETLRTLLKEEGPSALFSGVLPALVLVINPILQYTIFEQLKNMLETRRMAANSKHVTVGPKDAFVMGAIGKLLATGITYPYITVKSRAHVKKDVPGEKKEGTVASLRQIVKEDGWAALYGGVGPKLTQSVLTAAFLFAFKDVLYDATVKLRHRVKQ